MASDVFFVARHVNAVVWFACFMQIHEAWSYGVQARSSAKDLHHHFDEYLLGKLKRGRQQDDGEGEDGDDGDGDGDEQRGCEESEGAHSSTRRSETSNSGGEGLEV